MGMRGNLTATRVKPDTAELITLRVLRRERLSPHFARVTLGGDEIDRFRYMGFDQWFRLFIPTGGDQGLARLPAKLDAMSYTRYLMISKAERPAMRNYTVRAYRPAGPQGAELDVDFVLHGLDSSAAGGSAPAAPAGPAAKWATSCAAGDVVAILDEGIGFNPAPNLDRVFLVADETGLPAAAGILASLAPDIRGTALIEVPSDEDRQQLTAPAGVEITWILRRNGTEIPGRTALAAATEIPVPAEPFYGWTVGERALPANVRRHWVRAGVSKENIMFCGYWRANH